MSLSDTIAQSLKSIESFLGNVKFTWKGNEYLCSTSGIGKGASLAEGGILAESDVVLVVRKEIFPNGIYPETDDLITFKGETYKVESVRANASDTFLRLMCNYDDQNI